ncbi:hypothetical protein SAMN06265171_1062 [Chryseobacterium rhizoplanae]|uniref:YD repeat-containing protein n=1 Tax=Chryseobacterium rhizoplanae TaxID=1609531 RepID=A0A521DR46_9FLAO|nr:RHS repeat protein [Chryseobacterium rhizoplanae]SMO74108.1 hypothetical protein SAMN06265171_1062 [Chryseobacterium rhizoplanae]
MKKIILTLSSFSYLICFGQLNYSNTTDSPYNIIPPASESFYKSQFGNNGINDFRGEPMVNIPLFSINHGGIPFELDLKYIKAGVKVNDIPNSTGINWVLNTGGIITRTINDIADEKVVRELFPQLPNINMSNPGDWGAYVLQNKDHQTDIFNFTVGNYSGSFFLDQNFQPVILTKDNNCKIETVGSFSQNYQFKIFTNDGTVYHFGGTGFTEKTFNKEQASTAGVTSFYLKEITSSKTNETIKFEYEDVGVLRSVPTDIQESYNSDMTVVEEPNCGGHPTPSSEIQQTNIFLKISDPKRIKKIFLADKIISFDYSSDYILYNKLNNIKLNINNTLIKKYSFDYLDKINSNNKLLRYFLTNVKFYENNETNVTQEYKMEYDNPLVLPDRMSKEIDYLGYYNGKTNSLQTLIPNTNLFDNNSISAFNNFADRRPFSELAKYGTLMSITYPTKGKTVFEYEPITEAPKNATIALSIDSSYRTDTKDLFPYEYLGGSVQYDFLLYSMDPNISNPVMKARAVFKVLDEFNNVVYTSQQLTISKATTDLKAETQGTLALNPAKKYKFSLEILDNLCSNCYGDVKVNLKKLDIENGPGVRLKRQYDISESGITNIKRVYYTNYSSIPDIRKNNKVFVPDFKSHFLIQSLTPNPNTGSNCNDGTVSYPGSSSLVENIKSTPYLSSLEYSDLTQDDEDTNYFNLNDPMYSNITLSFGGDNFEKGGEEKKYYIKKRAGIEFDLFSPNFTQLGTDQVFINNEGILSALTESALKKFHRSFSFPNVDGKLLSDKIFKIQNNSVNYLKTTENKYSFIEIKNVHNILGSDVYPTITGGPYELKNKLITSYPTMVNEALLSEVKTMDFPNPNNQNNVIVKNIKNFYLNQNHQLSKQTVELPGGNILETSYQYADEKNNQKLIEANMVGIPLENKIIKKLNSSDAGKMILRSETIYPDQNNYPTPQAQYLLLPLSGIAYNIENNTPSTEITYNWYDEKGNVLQYTTKEGTPVTIIWGYNKTQPILKIEGVDYRKVLGFPGLDDLILVSDKDADPAKFDLQPANTEDTLINKLDQFRNIPEMAGYQVTTYTYDPLVGVRSITSPSGIRESYVYDSANRLEKVIDVNGKVLKEMKYNYKN